MTDTPEPSISILSSQAKSKFKACRFNPLNLLTFGRYKKQCLLLELLEISRGARMVSNGNDEHILSNSKFKELCAPFGPPSLKTLIGFFGATNNNAEQFAILKKNAVKGIASQNKLAHKTENKTSWYAITAEPLSGWKNHIHWRVDDITTEYDQQEKLNAEHDKLIDYTDNAPVGFFSVNEFGRFEFVNATFARWLGKDVVSILNHDYLHDYMVEIPESAAPYDIKENGGVRQYAEVRMKSGNGREFLASITQTVVHHDDGKIRTRAVINDLSAEQAIRQALQDSEDRFRQFFEEAPVGIAILDEDNQMKDCNMLLANMVEKKHAEIDKHPFTELIDYADWTLATDTIKRIRSGEVLSDPQEIRLWMNKQKKPLPCHMYTQRFSEGNNIAIHFLDLTQQKNLENQFIQSQKMQAVGQLAGGIAHDFNNLLTAIIGFCDLLLLRHKPGDPSFGDIQQIKQNSNRAANLVRQLLAFSRQQTLRPKVQDITDILTEVAHLLRRLIGANIELQLVHGNNLGLVKVDSGQMEQVLVNMVVNARDAMPDGGDLIITTSHIHNEAPMTFGQDIMPIGEWVKIDVADSGTGISPDIMERILEPFFTTKDVGKGTGLGLATVYGIIRQTGGYLGISSKVGEGTTFSIYLPCVHDDEEIQDQTPNVPEEITGDLTGSARILLVEDEDAVRTFSTRALTNKGYEVLTAENGDAGLEVFKNLDKPIDLLITDVMMPGKDGPTLAKEIRMDAPDLKIIFISGYTEEKLKDTLGEKIYFLPKPFTLKDLAAKVKDVLQE
ncbi:MAG: hybrid sensor histidine kinase/response regulator [Alphaproteobacteria bacterium CG1_02_46_17]|nr:MAG: hybrid sensor histidine kinase/response regulator [Alphaproteobacteria bacterium CG1_02_46_17]